jgi:3-hydroxyisobutyrate dehydrogenase-like beta-hydroxyacid dehydrogenase
MTRIAVVGTGRMGGAIARRLKRGGFEVSVWDRTRSKAEALGVGRVANSPADAVWEAGVIISMVTGPQAVRAIYFGDTGIFQAAVSKTIVDMSTAGPDAAEELANSAEAHGARLVSAPVIGSVPAVESGTALVLAGASRVEDLEPARPVLERLGEVRYVGDQRTAAALKLVANSMLAIVTAATAELMTTAVDHGLDPAQVFWLLARVAPGIKAREAGFLNNVHEPTMFAVRDMLKDLDLGLALYQPSEASRPSVPIVSLVRDLFAGVAAQEPELDISAIVDAYSKETLGRREPVGT